MSVILDGAQTCFLRVNQSYSAKMIGLESAYLRKDFFDNTENCYSELSELAKEVTSLASNQDDIEMLSEQVYWFHRQENFENPFTVSEEQESRSQSESYKQVITEKFKSIESLSSDLVKSFTKVRDGLSTKQKNSFLLQLFAGVILITFFGLILFQVSRRRRGASNRDEFENEVMEWNREGYHHTDSMQADQKVEEKERHKIEVDASIAKQEYDLSAEIKDIIKDLSAAFFNLNSTINISGIEKIVHSKRVSFSGEELRDFFKLVIRFVKGGKFPVQIEFKKKRKGDQIILSINAVNTNYCLYLNDTLKNSLEELREINTHDGITLGFFFEKDILLETCNHQSDEYVKNGLKSLYVGQKKDLIKRMGKDS